WQRLASTDADRAYEAMRVLAAARDQTVPLLKERLRPVDASKLQRLLKEVDSDDFALREKAQRELEEMGRFIRPALKKAMQGDVSLEGKRRMERILQGFDSEAPTPEQLRTLR